MLISLILAISQFVELAKKVSFITNLGGRLDYIRSNSIILVISSKVHGRLFGLDVNT